jgi:two-component system LytT family response regulator
VVRFLDFSRIDWIEAFDYYVKVHTKENVHLIRTSIKKLIGTLDQQMFLRIHRSSVINTSRIESIDTKSGEWKVNLKNGLSLKVGRVYKKELMDFLED